MKKKHFLVFLLSLATVLIIVGCSGGLSGSDYEGTWTRLSTSVGGQQASTASATLTLTADTFNSGTPVCSNSGGVSANGPTMIWSIENTDCPGPVGVGTQQIFTYSVSPDGNQLTLVNNQYGAEVKEEYRKA